jgi:hypothetical protein
VPELLVLKYEHDEKKYTTEQITLSNKKAAAYILRKCPGYVVEVQPDGYFQTLTNPHGKGWRGDRFILIKTDDTKKEKKDYNVNLVVDATLEKTKKIEILDQVIDIEKTKTKGTVETQGYAPGLEREILTVAENKIEKMKVDYGKTDRILTARAAKSIK